MSKIALSPVNIPGIGKTLISSASLVFPTSVAESGLAQASFTLVNPFTASINLLEISAVATYGNLTLGKISDVDHSSDPIHADGHANITSPSLPFDMNMDPSLITQFLTTAAENNHVDLGPLPALLQTALRSSYTRSSVSFQRRTSSVTTLNATKINVTVDPSTPSCVRYAYS